MSAANPSVKGMLAGKVALVTGANGGIGAATVRALLDEGASVLATDLAPTAGHEIFNRKHARYLPHDVREESQWQFVVGVAEDHFGRLDILVNNAGIGEGLGTTPETETLAQWRRIQSVNVEGTFLGCKIALPALRRAGGGSIVNLSSLAALVATPFIAAYGASKAAVMQFTQSVAIHAAADHIRCNCIHPGQILTPMFERMIDVVAQQQRVGMEAAAATLAARCPLRELGRPEDVANAIVFLASDRARHVTGASLMVDGGMSVAPPG